MHNPWHRSTLALVARTVVILMLLVALSMPAQDENKKKLHAIALIDQSATGELNSIHDRLTTVIKDKANLTINPVVSDLGSAIRDALWEFDPATQGAIILASDGRWNPDTLEALRNASAAKTPVFWLPILADQSSPGIISVSAPARARAGQRIGVSVDIQLGRLNQAELFLLVNNQPMARKEATKSGVFDFLIDVPAVGPVIVGAELHDVDDGVLVAEREQGALVNIISAPSVLVVSDNPSVFGKSLRDGGWPVLESRPQDFAAQVDRLASSSLLVLDDVATSDLAAMAWNRIEHAVRQDAMGLLVLGGPNSFGLGAYRDSQLESLLPVVSEPPDDEAPVSLVFLIDVSGSMGRTGVARNRLQMAKQATIETARALRPVDRVGLITFDVQSNELLSVDARANHADAIEKVWPQSASGGTALMPSLNRAVAVLQADGAEQQLLVLLTDGFLEDADLQQLDELLGHTDIELVAMILDNNAQSEINALEEIAAANGGRLIRIDDVLRLPMLMRHEVESRRPALVSKATRPRVMLPAVWLPDDVAWPEVTAYLLTRPREEAQVYLVSERGDVLLAGMSVGAGKVFAVTSGFSGGSKNWLQWDRWPEFATGLVGFLATQDTHRFEASVTQYVNNSAQLNVNFRERKLPDDVRAVLVAPSGKTESVNLQARSPGELAATLGLDEPGQYNIVVNADAVTTRHRFVSQSPGSQSRGEAPVARTWLNDGVLQLWESESLRELAPEPDWRAWLVALALLLFLSTLVAERLPSRLRRRSYSLSIGTPVGACLAHDQTQEDRV